MGVRSSCFAEDALL